MIRRIADTRLADNIEKSAVGVDAEESAVVDKGVGSSQAFSRADGASEELVATTDSEVSERGLSLE